MEAKCGQEYPSIFHERDNSFARILSGEKGFDHLTDARKANGFSGSSEGKDSMVAEAATEGKFRTDQLGTQPGKRFHLWSLLGNW